MKSIVLLICMSLFLGCKDETRHHHHYYDENGNATCDGKRRPPKICHDICVGQRIQGSNRSGKLYSGVVTSIHGNEIRWASDQNCGGPSYGYANELRVLCHKDHAYKVGDKVELEDGREAIVNAIQCTGKVNCVYTWERQVNTFGTSTEFKANNGRPK